MYVPGSFDVSDPERLAAFIEAHAFATLVTHTAGGLFASHLPLLVGRGAPGRGLTLRGHLARANPHWRAFVVDQGAGDRPGVGESLAIFHGPHGYVSPSWYATSPAVPTWNYAVVHAYGEPVVIDDPVRARDSLGALVAAYEGPRQAPWRLEEQPAAFVDRAVEAIVVVEMPVRRLEGKFKLSQNKPAADVAGVLEGLAGEGTAAAEALAALMRGERR